ncbi:acyl-CoA synthetase [Rhodococcus sp. X156]|uniref:acyl-CoA synthetase n=1 Tax=Rhodococcus sp. X156 TaxID=2499145 RepID=UPI000FDA499A|nr:acyl-CoA synthetase [Rhodococcus sp. X156]
MAYNIADLFEHAVDLFPDRKALACEDIVVSYRELEERANRLAHHLAAHGVGTGSHVGLYTHNRVEAIIWMMAVYKLRGVIINVNYRYGEQELRYVVQNSDMVALLTEREFADKVAAVRPETPTLQHVLVLDNADGAAAGTDFEAAMAGESAERDFGERSSDDLYILYTGGTTGPPKGVMWRHEDVWRVLGGGVSFVTGEAMADEWAQAREGEASGGMTRLCLAPLIHGNAQWAAMQALFAGDTVVLVPKFDPVAIWHSIAQHKVNVVVLIGDAMARPMIEEYLRGDYDASSVFAISSSAALFSPTVKDQYLDALPNVVITDAVGSSETGFSGIGMLTKDSEKWTEGPRVKLIPNAIVVNDEGKQVEPGSGEIGRLARGGYIPMGYYKDPEKTATLFTEVDGKRYAVPGDLARIEADGTMTLLGRGNTCVNTGGEKVFPEEVEGALKGHPDVFDALVIGVPDETWGQRVAALVQPRPGTSPAFDDLDRHVRGQLAGYKAPRSLWLVEEIERLSTGKADYKWARQHAEQRPEEDLCAPRSANSSA